MNIIMYAYRNNIIIAQIGFIVHFWELLSQYGPFIKAKISLCLLIFISVLGNVWCSALYIPSQKMKLYFTSMSCVKTLNYPLLSLIFIAHCMPDFFRCTDLW